MGLMISYLLYSNFDSDMQKPFHQIRSEDLVVFERSGDPYDTMNIREQHTKTLEELIAELYPN